MFAKNSSYKLSTLLIIACIGILVSTSAPATVFHGVDFPDGAASFADSVVSYDPAYGGGNVPTATYQDPSQALGIPNYPEGTDPEYVSLGAGGRIVLRFTNNSLTGSGSNALDLWIFEIGPDVEDTDVDISKDGNTWFSVGKVFGSTAGIDIDAFGFGTSDFFSFIRLTDVISEGATSGATVGADIDAVGAISSAPPVNVPEPATIALLMIGLAAVGYQRRERIV
ncbi:MAG: PEP-CTERM sorting domain-containing protein [Sulfurimicrobium sp.]|nr:PEP-CTERM sorting domain-containing protein [Sulfurimicrobium sp.]